jgi:hypothetical protein
MKAPAGNPHGQLAVAGRDGSYKQLSLAAKRGAATRLAPGLYAVGATLPVEQITRQHLLAIVAEYWPGGVICAKSAFAGGIPTGGTLYITPGDVSQRRSPLALPGVTITPVEGPQTLPGDMSMPSGLRMSGTARGLVENINVRGSQPTWRAGTQVVEDKIDELARTGGAGRIKSVLDQLDVIEGSFDRSPVNQVRTRLVAVLGSFTGANSPVTWSSRLAARLAGVPYDQRRVEMVQALVATLESQTPQPRHLSAPQARWEWLPFFEAYFSNFIEGTEFGVEEARLIAVEGAPSARPADAHDITATFRLASDPADRMRVPESGHDLAEILSHRHQVLMAARPEKDPGRFKQVPNYAGGYAFVAPELVLGTLEHGFAAMSGLRDPFARSVAVMVLITECHPFLDGNGRVARLTANAELSVGGQVRICIPSVFRSEYLSALAGFSAGAGTGQSLVSVLAFAQRWTAEIDWTTFNGANRIVEVCNGYLDPGVADKNGQRLMLPSTLTAAPVQ